MTFSLMGCRRAPWSHSSRPGDDRVSGCEGCRTGHFSRPLPRIRHELEAIHDFLAIHTDPRAFATTWTTSDGPRGCRPPPGRGAGRAPDPNHTTARLHRD